MQQTINLNEKRKAEIMDEEKKLAKEADQAKEEVKKDSEEAELNKKKKLAKMLKDKPIKSIHFPELVDAVLTPDDKVVYLVKEKGKLSIRRQWITKEEILKPPSKTKMPSTFFERSLVTTVEKSDSCNNTRSSATIILSIF